MLPLPGPTKLGWSELYHQRLRPTNHDTCYETPQPLGRAGSRLPPEKKIKTLAGLQPEPLGHLPKSAGLCIIVAEGGR